MRAGSGGMALATLLLVTGCGQDPGPAAPTGAAATATAEIEDDARWVDTTAAGATITAEAPADDDHPLVAQAEEYREAADAPEVFYVLVICDNTQGTETVDVFGGGRLVTEEGEQIPVRHFAALEGVFKTHIEGQLPRDLQDEAQEWYAALYERQAVGPGSVEEVLLGTTVEVPGIIGINLALDEEGGEATLEPDS